MNIVKKADRLINEFRKLARISGGTGTSEPASIQCAIKCVERTIVLLKKIQEEEHSDNFWCIENAIADQLEIKQELESRL